MAKGFQKGNKLGKKFNNEHQPEPGKNGRPPILPDLKMIMAKILGEEKDGITAAEAIAQKWRQMAVGGNIKAGELLYERGFGKAPQPIEGEIDLNKKITIKIE